MNTTKITCMLGYVAYISSGVTVATTGVVVVVRGAARDCGRALRIWTLGAAGASAAGLMGRVGGGCGVVVFWFCCVRWSATLCCADRAEGVWCKVGRGSGSHGYQRPRRGGGGKYFLLEQPYGPELKTLAVALTNEALEVPTKTIQFPLEDGHREDGKIIFVRIVL